MSYKESAHKNLLMGVSQQVPQDRLPGQLSAQLNMISDPVTGLRRRPGTEYISLMRSIDLGTSPRPRVYHTDINSRSVVIMVFAHSGDLYVFDDTTGELLQSYLARPYLVTALPNYLHFVTMGDEVFIANTGVKPAKSAGLNTKNPDQYGYFYVVSGQYNKLFTLNIRNRATGLEYSASYLTPIGSGVNDPALTAAHAIAWQLYGKIYGRTAVVGDVSRPAVAADPALAPVAAATVTSGLSDGYVALQLAPGWELTITTNAGNLYMRTSNDMTVRASDELPATLPTNAPYPATSGGTAFMNGVIVAAGTSSNLTYYRWDAAGGRWIEDADYGADTGMFNMPERLKWDSGGWAYGAPAYVRRPSGDAESNPDFNFLKEVGITGMTTFQGRLVLLSNEYACMSASNDPLRWYKRSAAALSDDDPVEVAAQGTLTAPYVYGITYNKDLLLFSRRYQAVIPGGGVITPRTASLSVTTTYEVDIDALPVAAGRSLYFAAPRSLGFVGMHEMSPSPSTESHYVADDITSHIPSYIIGPTAFIAAASTSGYLVMGTESGDRNDLTVFQYIWAGGEKAQAAWHRWVFNPEVVAAYFTGDTLMMVVYQNAALHLLKLNLRALAGSAGLRQPRYDMQSLVVVAETGVLTMPTAYYDTIRHDPRAYLLNPMTGQHLERSVFDYITDDGLGFTHLGCPEAIVGQTYVVGHGYLSEIEPSPPVIRDFNEVPITTTRATLRGYRVAFTDSGEFEYKVGDAIRPGNWLDTTPLRLFSQQLGAGQPFVASAVVALPARVDLHTSSLALRTSGPYDMNINSIEYGYKHNLRYRRT